MVRENWENFVMRYGGEGLATVVRAQHAVVAADPDLPRRTWHRAELVSTVWRRHQSENLPDVGANKQQAAIDRIGHQRGRIVASFAAQSDTSDLLRRCQKREGCPLVSTAYAGRKEHAQREGDKIMSADTLKSSG